MEGGQDAKTEILAQDVSADIIHGLLGDRAPLTQR
jgi:hypothetical protein